MSYDIEWKVNEQHQIMTIEAQLGPFVAHIIQAAVVSLHMEYYWIVMDMRSHKSVRAGKKAYAHAMAHIYQQPPIHERAIKDCTEEAGKALVKAYEEYAGAIIEDIVLGANE